MMRNMVRAITLLYLALPFSIVIMQRLGMIKEDSYTLDTSRSQNDLGAKWLRLVQVPFLATREAVAPLANDPFMLGRPIRSFRDLEHQNWSIISDSIDSARCGQIFSSNFGHQGVSGATCK